MASIAINRAAGPVDGWQAVLADAVRDPAELCRLLGLPAALADPAAAGQFPLLVPRPFLARICPGRPDDPLLAQVLPRHEEVEDVPQFVPDPLGETSAACAGRVLRKYKHRLLIVASGACGIRCRFCFRRHFPYAPPLAPRLSPPLLRHIAADTSLDEVILSGGDPLTISDAQLGRLFQQLAAIPHLRRLRIHTRMPVVIPQRVTDELLAALRATRLAAFVVLHVNHPAEIDDAVAAALGRLVDAGVPVLNQAVLLRGVNDDVDVLAGLCRRLVDLRVLPYYLHQLDRVAGAAHFEVHESRGLELMGQLRACLPGYALPRYVRERIGAASKEPLT
jgi:L-lysine 2,3-aminomutase